MDRLGPNGPKMTKLNNEDRIDRTRPNVTELTEVNQMDLIELK